MVLRFVWLWPMFGLKFVRRAGKCRDQQLKRSNYLIRPICNYCMSMCCKVERNQSLENPMINDLIPIKWQRNIATCNTKLYVIYILLNFFSNMFHRLHTFHIPVCYISCYTWSSHHNHEVAIHLILLE